MKNFFSLLLLCALISSFTSCGGEDPETGCADALNNGGTLEIDGETLSLSVAQLLITSGFDGDNYLFQVGGLSSECNELKTLSFSAEITTNSDFDGSYEIVDFFDAGLNDVTSVNTTVSNVTSGQQSLTQINSGTMTVKKLADKEYEVDMTGNKVGGGTVAVSFRSEF